MLPINFAMAVEDRSDLRYIDRLYLKFGARMFRVANALLDNESESWRCVQDAMVTLAGHISAYKSWDEVHQMNFLCKCTKMHAYRLFIKKNKIDEIAILQADYDIASMACKEHEGACIDDIVVSEENMAILLSSLQQMDDTYSDMLFFKYFLNMSDIEIAHELKLKPEIVSMRIQTGMMILTNQFGCTCVAKDNTKLDYMISIIACDGDRKEHDRFVGMNASEIIIPVSRMKKVTKAARYRLRRGARIMARDVIGWILRVIMILMSIMFVAMLFVSTTREAMLDVLKAWGLIK